MTGAIPHVSNPTAGFYRMKLVKGAPWSPVRIWLGQSPDPDDGEPRGEFTWRAEINGHEERIEKAWPWCAGEPIGEAEFRYLLATHQHAVAHEPDMPEAAPFTPIDLHTMPTLF